MKKVIFSILCVLLIGIGFLFTIRLVDNPTHAQDSLRAIYAESPSTKLLNPTPPNSVPQFAAVQNVQDSPASNPIQSSNIAQRPDRKNLNGFNLGPTHANGAVDKPPSNVRPFVAPSRPVSKLPANAQQIKNLVRANYTLSRNVAETMEKLFALDKNKKVETNIIASEKADIVQFQVTTDEQTQCSVAEFLNNVYPKPDIDQVQAAPSRGHIQVSLELPGMTCRGCVSSVRSSLTSIGATEFEANLATNACSFSLPANVNIESQLKIAAKKTQHLRGWSIVK